MTLLLLGKCASLLPVDRIEADLIELGYEAKHPQARALVNGHNHHLHPINGKLIEINFD